MPGRAVGGGHSEENRAPQPKPGARESAGSGVAPALPALWPSALSSLSPDAAPGVVGAEGGPCPMGLYPREHSCKHMGFQK